MSWPKNFKKSFWSVFSCSTKQQTVSLSDCDKKWILYDSWWWPSQWLTEKLQSTSQSPRLAPKRSWSLFGGLLPVWPTTAFWKLVKPLHLRSVLSILTRCTENCRFCRNATASCISQERAQFFSMTMPDHTSQNTSLQKLSKLNYEILPHPPCLPDLLPPNYHFFKHLNNFLQGKLFHN